MKSRRADEKYEHTMNKELSDRLNRLETASEKGVANKAARDMSEVGSKADTTTRPAMITQPAVAKKKPAAVNKPTAVKKDPNAKTDFNMLVVPGVNGAEKDKTK